MTHFKLVNGMYLFNNTRHPIVDVVLATMQQPDPDSYVKELGLSEEAVLEAVDFIKRNPEVRTKHLELINTIN